MNKRFARLANPFPLIGYNGPAYFCDRERELTSLIEAIHNGRNVTMIARRRIGKSALLEHLRFTLDQNELWIILYIDLMKTSSALDLYKLLAKALYETRTRGILKKLTDLEIMSRLRMTLSVNPITQLPELSFDLRQKTISESMESLMDWLARADKVLIIFDEFQQILNYKEKNVEGLLRSEMMRLPGIRYIFSGSDQHLLEDMFNNSSRPFFSSTQNISLDSIDSVAYKKFISNHFNSVKRKISQDALDYVLHVADGETFAVQKLCNSIFASGIPFVTLPIAKEQLVKVLNEQQPYYERIRALLKGDSVQFHLLRALARAGEVSEITGKDFMGEHGFTNSSSIFKAIRALEGYHLVSRKILSDGKLGYFINDALFKAWLNTLPQ